MQTQKVSEQLKEAKKLIARPEKWCKGSYSKLDLVGNVAKRCAVGAIQNVPGYSSELYDALYSVAPGDCDFSVVTFNDRGRVTHAEVMRLYDEAIELAKLNEKLAGI